MVLYNHTKEHVYELSYCAEYRNLSIGFSQALWLACKHNKPFDYEIYDVKDLRQEAKGDVLVDVVFQGFKNKDIIKLCASVFADYKRPTLPEREIVTIESDGSKEVYSGLLEIPLIGIVHDNIIVYKNGERMVPGEGQMSCVIRLLPQTDRIKIAAGEHTIYIHNKGFVSVGGFLIPENMLEVYKKTYVGLCKDFSPIGL